MNLQQLPEFDKDLKRLFKKYKSILDDLQKVIKVIKAHPDARPPFSYRIDGLKIKTIIIKVKKITCASLKGRGVHSGLRLIYAYDITDQTITLIEFYQKNEKELEDSYRILDHFKN